MVKIEDLIGQALPGRPRYTVGPANEVRKDGDVQHVPIYYDGEQVGEAQGVTGDELGRSAESIADEHERGQE